MKRFKEARDRGARYLLTPVHDDGSFGDPQKGLCDYYKAPAALHVAGHSAAATYTTRMEQALGIARWMKRLMDLQPDYPNRLYSTYSRAHGLITDPDLDPDPGDEPIRYVMYKDAEEDQFFFHPGIAGGFLARLYKSTGDGQWLDLAVEYMRFAEGASDFLFGLPRAGKVAWAASELFTLTGETKYRDMAIRIGDILIELQFEEGYWGWMFDREPSNDSTDELTYWLDEIHQAVGAE